MRLPVFDNTLSFSGPEGWDSDRMIIPPHWRMWGSNLGCQYAWPSMHGPLTLRVLLLCTKLVGGSWCSWISRGVTLCAVASNYQTVDVPVESIC